MNNILTGAAMGAALTTAGVYAPDIIIHQFNFTDFTMLQTFLSAAAGSTYVFPLLDFLSLHRPLLVIKSPSPSHLPTQLQPPKLTLQKKKTAS